jgi:hypothetical protein
MRCPVCAGEVPWTVVRSKPFQCPICNEPLRVRQASPLLAISFGACGYSLTFLIAYLMGLKGNGLFLVTFFLGSPASFLVAGVVGGVIGWLLRLPPPLERDPSADLYDGRILHIESPTRPRKDPQ